MMTRMTLKQAAIILAGILPLTALAQPTPPPTPPPAAAARPPAPIPPLAPANSTEMPEKSKLSYVLGVYFANNITNQLKHGGDITLDYEIMMNAIRDVLQSKPQKYSEQEIGTVMGQLRSALQAKHVRDEEMAKAKNDQFMADFKKTPNVITTPDGIEYQVIKDGTGPMPKESDSVLMAYRGSLVDGTVFDQNDNFPANASRGLIAGWQKVIPMMKVGSKWKVVIPARLGYGPRPMAKIPANSTLIFDMELKSIVPAAASTTPPALPALANRAATVPVPSPGPAPHVSSSPPNPPNAVSGEIIKVPSAEDLKHGAKIEVIKAGQTNAVNTQ